MGESPPWPGPHRITSGRPWPSTSCWIFVESPPRERPRAWSGGSWRRFLWFHGAPCGALEIGAVLVSATDRGVDRDRPVKLTIRVGTDQQRIQDAVPGPIGGPGPMTLPHRLPGPEVGREIAPGDPAPVTVDDPLDHLPMIPPRPPRPGALSGEQGLDRLPLGVGQHASSAHPPTITFRTPTTLGDTP